MALRQRDLEERLASIERNLGEGNLGERRS